MTIYTYHNSSPTNYVKKSIKDAATFNGILRDNCDLINPVVQIDSEQAQVFFDDMGNYAYIPQFERYYYITKVEHNYQHLYTLYFHCDVLMSHWSKVQHSSAIAARTSDRTEVQTKIPDPMMAFSNSYRYVGYKMEPALGFDGFGPPSGDSINYVVTIAKPYSAI